MEHADNFFDVDRSEDKSLVPVRLSSRKGDLLDVDLLLLADGLTHHYVLITNLKNLIYRVKKRSLNFTEQLCRNCFHVCASKDVYERYPRSCLHNEPAIINLPTEQRNKVKFINYKARWFAPIVIFFDLESVIRLLAQCCQERQNTQTLALELHEPCECCLVGVEWSTETQPLFVQLERSPDCMVRAHTKS